MSTPLANYMSEHEIGDAEFALRIGKDRTLVNRLRRGEVKPTLEVAAAIERETDGKVVMQAWIPGDADAAA
jgi:DNA-binding transcriptional regulator YdaS (Cro superfamily)